MPSLYKSVLALYQENNDITLNDLKKLFMEASPKVLANYLSRLRKELPHTHEKITKITLESLEPLIAKKLEKNPTNQDLKLAVEIIKIKQTESGLTDEIDIEKFYKIGVNDGE